MFHVHIPKPYVVTMQINGAELPMEVDTGASLTLISKTTFDRLWDARIAPNLQSTSSKLQTYTREDIEVLGDHILPGAVPATAATCSRRKWS